MIDSLFTKMFCVFGRLVPSNLPDEAKYQKIVPPESQLARLMIVNAYEKPRMWYQISSGTNPNKPLDPSQSW